MQLAFVFFLVNLKWIKPDHLMKDTILENHQYGAI